MHIDEIEVRLLPHNITVRAAKGASILDVAREAAVEMDSNCNGLGTCGKCLVRHLEGIVEEPHPDEARLLNQESLAQGIRLACRVSAHGNSAFEIVKKGELENRILSDGLMPQFMLNPSLQKLYVEMAPPSLEEASDDLFRIEQASGLKLQRIALSLMRKLPSILRDSEYKITLAVSNGVLLDIEPGNTVDSNFGVAVDIGTTTVVASLFNLSTGREMAIRSCLNPQKSFGLDVLSRIQHARNADQGLQDLQHAIVQGINGLIAEGCDEAGIGRESIYEVVVAANSTMMHLLLGIDPAGIGCSPYVPVFTGGQSLRACDVGLEISPLGEVYCLPSVSAYVGADIVAGILTTELAKKNERALLIDIGTNGEIVFCSGREFVACSCAAGPALEGMNISCGMRAAEGAIDQVSIADDVGIRTIGAKPASGICGSGIIDAIAEMLNAGILNQSGRFEKIGGEGLAERFQENDGRVSFVLSFGRNGMDTVRLTQKDIRQVQLAKGAVLSGIVALIKYLNLDLSEVDRVYIAGAFGCHIRADNFVRIGILPHALTDRLAFVGNTSKSGAALCLLSQEERVEAEAIARRVRYIELSCYPGFDRLFAQSLSFPGTTQ